jgi:hypothetical protein
MVRSMLENAPNSHTESRLARPRVGRRSCCTTFYSTYITYVLKNQLYSKYNGAINMFPIYATNHRVPLHCFCTRSNLRFLDFNIRSEDSLLTYAFTQLYSALSGGELFLSSRYLRSDRKASLGRTMC